MRIWFEVLSELFVNISAAWFAVVFVDSQNISVNNFRDILTLIFKLLLGTISLFVAKYFREKIRRKR